MIGEVNIPLAGGLNYKTPVNQWFALNNNMGGINVTIFSSIAPQ
jgi:hypothetical protein